MSVNFLQLKVGFLDHIKTQKIIRSLGAEGVLSLMRLWEYTAINAESGTLNIDAEELEIAAHWPGEPGKFESEMLRVGMVDEVDEGYYIHDWLINQSWVAGASARREKASKAGKKRHENARQKAEPTAKKPAKSAAKQGENEAATRIISHLNLVAGKKFTTGASTIKPLKAAMTKITKEHLKSGNWNDAEQALIAIIDCKCDEWLNDPKMVKFLRPATLFCAKHLDSYLEQSATSAPSNVIKMNDNGSVNIADMVAQ